MAVINPFSILDDDDTGDLEANLAAKEASRLAAEAAAAAALAKAEAEAEAKAKAKSEDMAAQIAATLFSVNGIERRRFNNRQQQYERFNNAVNNRGTQEQYHHDGEGYGGRRNYYQGGDRQWVGRGPHAANEGGVAVNKEGSVKEAASSQKGSDASDVKATESTVAPKVETVQEANVVTEQGEATEAPMADTNSGETNQEPKKKSNKKKNKAKESILPDSQQKQPEKEDYSKTLTLKEYEKTVEEKKKALEPTKVEERKVEKTQFVGMKAVGKLTKKQDDEVVFIKVNKPEEKKPEEKKPKQKDAREKKLKPKKTEEKAKQQIVLVPKVDIHEFRGRDRVDQNGNGNRPQSLSGQAESSVRGSSRDGINGSGPRGQQPPGWVDNSARPEGPNVLQNRRPYNGGYQGRNDDGYRGPSYNGYQRGNSDGNGDGYRGPRDGYNGGYQGARNGNGYNGPRDGGYNGPRDGGYNGYNGPRDGGYNGYNGPRDGGYNGPRDGGYNGQYRHNGPSPTPVADTRAAPVAGGTNQLPPPVANTGAAPVATTGGQYRGGSFDGRYQGGNSDRGAANYNGQGGRRSFDSNRPDGPPPTSRVKEIVAPKLEDPKLFPALA